VESAHKPPRATGRKAHPGTSVGPMAIAVGVALVVAISEYRIGGSGEFAAHHQSSPEETPIDNANAPIVLHSYAYQSGSHSK